MPQNITNIGSTTPDSWAKTQLPIAAYNCSSEDAPPFACMQLKQPKTFQRTKTGTSNHKLNEAENRSFAQEKIGNQIVWDVSKPDGEGAGQQNAAQFVFAGVQGIKKHSFGTVYQGYPARTLHDSLQGGLPNWASCGPVSDEWFVSPKGWAFTNMSRDESAPVGTGEVRTIWITPNTIKAPPLIGAAGFTPSTAWSAVTGGYAYSADQFLTPFSVIKVQNNFSTLNLFSGFGAYGGFNGFGVYGGYGVYGGGFSGYAGYGALGGFGSFNGFAQLTTLSDFAENVGHQYTIDGDAIIVPARGRYVFTWRGIVWSGRLGQIDPLDPPEDGEAAAGAGLSITSYRYISETEEDSLLEWSGSTVQMQQTYFWGFYDSLGEIADADGTLASATAKLNLLLSVTRNKLTIRGAQNVVFTGVVELEEGDGLKFKNSSESSISLWSPYVTIELVGRHSDE